MAPFPVERRIESLPDPHRILASAKGARGCSLLLDGRGFEEGWGPLLALDPVLLAHETFLRRGQVRRTLERVDEIAARRRRRGGPPGTGLALLLSYELLAEEKTWRTDAGCPAELVLMAVDGSVRWSPDGESILTTPPRNAAGEDEIARRVEVAERPFAHGAFPRPRGPLRSSLPRDAYLRAAQAVKEHILEGNIYQANLTQRFQVASGAEPCQLFRRLSAATPAPRAAFVETPGFALASVSPEVFLTVDRAGRVETRPIKGTRARGATPEEDARAARSLLESEKDAAELLMIVDLERNDLGRICRTGTVRVPELAGLRSYAAVHHLVARVEGSLREGVTPGALIRAAFPGGSITGAPKKRATEILRDLEPVPRGPYTGSLFWLGDDGTWESSILIRSVVMAGGTAYVGAGGGIVADSEPEAEWRESNDKARALLGALGCVPEEAR